MSKGKDPAFLFYPGDASLDIQFMNRLERGAYFDLVRSQRMYGGFTMPQLQKILGDDFEHVKEALFSVLKTDRKGLYYIEWVKSSIDKREEFSRQQKERIQKYWEGKKDTVEEPR
jgi:hypothetical protein